MGGQIPDGVISILDIAGVQPEFFLEDFFDSPWPYAFAFQRKSASSGIAESSHEVM